MSRYILLHEIVEVVCGNEVQQSAAHELYFEVFIIAIESTIVIHDVSAVCAVYYPNACVAKDFPYLISNAASDKADAQVAAIRLCIGGGCEQQANK